MSTRHPSGSQNGSTSPNFLKRKLETSFLQHESKIEDSLRFFPDIPLIIFHISFKFWQDKRHLVCVDTRFLDSIPMLWYCVFPIHNAAQQWLLWIVQPNVYFFFISDFQTTLSTFVDNGNFESIFLNEWMKCKKFGFINICVVLCSVGEAKWKTSTQIGTFNEKKNLYDKE